MPISYKFDRTTRRVHTTVAGPVSVDDIQGHLLAACKEQILPYAELIDARKAAPPILSATDLWHAASRVRQTEFNRQGLGPRAVVVEDLAMFGMTRIFVTLVSDFFPINVFRDPHMAEGWLREYSGGPANLD